MMLRRLVLLAATTSLGGTLGCNASVVIGEQETDTEPSGTSDTPGDASGPTEGSTASASAGGSTGGPETTNPSGGGSDDTSTRGAETGSTTADPTDGTGTDTTGTDPTGGSTTGPQGDGITLFINFDGPTLTEGIEDATTNTTQISLLAMALEPYPGSAADRAEILTEVEEDFAGINITITDERPKEGPYTMVVVTPTSPVGGAAGLASIDCDNAQPSSVVAAFTAPQGNVLTPVQIASTVSREAGFGLGLERVENETALMTGSFALGTDFVTECTPSSGKTACSHLGCEAGSQNSFAELQARANE